ncbi:hypothetical protein GCM10027578_15800 [Spirosoma luteolum]
MIDAFVLRCWLLPVLLLVGGYGASGQPGGALVYLPILYQHPAESNATVTALQQARQQSGSDSVRHRVLTALLASAHDLRGQPHRADSLLWVFGETAAPASGQARALVALCRGNYWQRRDQYRRADTAYQQASLALTDAPADRALRALLLSRQAALTSRLQTTALARRRYHESVVLARRASADSALPAAIVYQWAEFERRQQQPARADSLFTIALRLKQRAVGSDHPATALYHNRLGLACERRGQLDRALRHYRLGLALLTPQRPASPDTPTDTTGNIFYLPDLISTQERLNSQLGTPIAYEEAIAGWQRRADSENLNLLTLLQGAAFWYRSHTRYGRAEQLYRDLLTRQTRLLGPMHSDLVSTLNGLAITCEGMGQFAEVEALYRRCIFLDTANERAGGNTFWLSTYENNLIQFYIRTGNWLQAERQLTDLRHRFERQADTGSLPYARTLQSLAQLQLQTGQYTRAIAGLTEAVRIQEQVRGPAHFDVLMQQQQLGTAYARAGRVAAAEQLLLHTIRPDYQTPLPEYLLRLDPVARFFVSRGAYAQADSLFERSLRLRRQLTDTLGLEAASTLSLWADALARRGQYDRADSLASRALTIRRQRLPPTHPDLAQSLILTTRIRVANRRPDAALRPALEAHTLTQRATRERLLVLNEPEKESFVAQQTSLLPVYLALLQQTGGSGQADLLGRAFESVAFAKQLLVSDVRSRQQAIYQRSDTLLRARYDLFRAEREQLTAERSRAIPDPAQLARLTHRTDSLEQLISLASADFRLLQTRQQAPGWQQIQAALGPGEAAVEFVRYPYLDGYQPTDSLLYGAFVLRPGAASPRFVFLGAEADLLPLLPVPRRAAPSDRLVYRGTDVDELPNGARQALYRRLWQPLDALLTGIQRIYTAPDGLLHQFSLATVSPPGRGRRPTYLIDRYDLRLLGSTAQLIGRANAPVSFRQATRTAVLFGGIDYGPVQPDTGQTILTNWPYLIGTRDEVVRIGRLLGSATEIRQGAQATETSFKALSGRAPGLLHVATHGFFTPLTADSATPDHPLLRSGLILANRNRLAQAPDSIRPADDGVLTALEVSSLQLDQTQLVVLSACETGLGDVQGTEGVYGLQRSFRMAGVRALLITLRAVPDRQTRQLMTAFYRHWKRGAPLPTAFRRAQLQMKRRWRSLWWDAFVLTE